MNTLCTHHDKLSICSDCASLTKSDVTLGEEDKQSVAEIANALCGDPAQAVAALTLAFQKDPLFACAWHATVSQCILDADPEAVEDYEDCENMANAAATMFMKSAFGIDPPIEG